MKPEDLIGPTVIHSVGTIRYANREFCDLIGVESSDELTDQRLDQFLKTSHRDQLADVFDRIDTNGAETLSLTVTLNCRDGTECDAIAVSSPALWEDTSQIRTTFIDMSQPPANDSLSFEGTALHEAPIGITIADVTREDEPLIYVSDGFIELTGYPREEALGRNCRFLQGEATREAPVAKMRAALDAEQPVTVEVRNYRKDGSVFWNRVTLSPIENETGEVTHYLGFQENVSEQKAHEKERLRFEAFAERYDEVMFITDENGVIEYVNPAFERVTEYSAGEAVGKTPRILNSGQQDEGFYADLWETIQADETWQTELTNRTKSGELYETTQEIVPITDTTGDIRYFVTIEREITKQQLTQQILDVLNRVLRHNIRNSITAINGHGKLIESRAENRMVEAAAETILDQTAKIERITERTSAIRDLIAVSEGDKAPTPMKFSAIEDLAEQYSERYANAIIDLTIHGNEDAAIQYGNVFEIAVKELIENAIEHNDQPTPRVEIVLAHSPEMDTATVEIADNGPRIPKATWETIKSGEETQLNHTNSIGLWVVYWSVTVLDGAIELSANEPRGNVITLDVPMTQGGRDAPRTG